VPAHSPSPRNWHRRSADPGVYKRARVFDGYVDAINATDGSGRPTAHVESPVCALLTRVGTAPVMQISCRDKNRIAIQGDILGRRAMGVCNVLCLTGDGVQAVTTRRPSPCSTRLDVAARIAADCASSGIAGFDQHSSGRIRGSGRGTQRSRSL